MESIKRTYHNAKYFIKQINEIGLTNTVMGLIMAKTAMNLLKAYSEDRLDSIMDRHFVKIFYATAAEMLANPNAFEGISIESMKNTLSKFNEAQSLALDTIASHIPGYDSNHTPAKFYVYFMLSCYSDVGYMIHLENTKCN